MQKPSFKTVADKLLSLLIYANIAAMAAAALWLGLARQWQVVWIGVVMLLASPYVVPIALIPSGIFAHFMSAFHARGDVGKERLMFLCTVGYLIGFISLWCASVFAYVMNNIAPQAVAVGLLWSATSAVLPLLWWAARDRGNLFIMILVEAAQLAVFVPVIAHLKTGDTSFWPCFFSIVAVLALEAVGQHFYEKKFIEKK